MYNNRTSPMRNYSLLLVFPIFLLASCKPVSISQTVREDGYTETIIATHPEDDWYNQKISDAVNDLVKTRALQERTENQQIIHNLKSEYPCRGREFFCSRSSTNRYAVGPLHSDDPRGTPDEDKVTQNGKTIETFTGCFGSDGPIHQYGEMSGSIILAIVNGACGDEKHLPYHDILYRGTYFSQIYDVDTASSFFDYQGKIGFVASKNEKYFIFFNGKIASPTFDFIRTTSCCMMPQPFLHVYADGTLLFVGERNGKVILTTVDLNKHL